MKKITKIIGLAAMLSAAVFIGCAPVSGDGSGSTSTGTTQTTTPPQASGPSASSPSTGTGSGSGLSQGLAVGAISGSWESGTGKLLFYPGGKGKVVTAYTPSVRATYVPVSLADLQADETFTWEMKSTTIGQIVLDTPDADGNILYIDFVFSEENGVPTLSIGGVSFEQDTSADDAAKIMAGKTMTTMLAFKAGTDATAQPAAKVDPTDPESALQLKLLIEERKLVPVTKKEADGTVVEVLGEKFPVMWTDTSADTSMKTAEVCLLNLGTKKIEGPFTSTYGANYLDSDGNLQSDMQSIILYVQSAAGGAVEEFVLDSTEGTSVELAAYLALTGPDDPDPVLDDSDTEQTVAVTLAVNEANEMILGKTYAVQDYEISELIEDPDYKQADPGDPAKKATLDTFMASDKTSADVSAYLASYVKSKFTGGFVFEDDADPFPVLKSVKFYKASNKYKAAVTVMTIAEDSGEASTATCIGTYVYSENDTKATIDNFDDASPTITEIVMLGDEDGDSAADVSGEISLPVSKDYDGDSDDEDDIGKYKVSDAIYAFVEE